MEGPLFEIDCPIEGQVGRGDLCVVGLGRRILDGDLGSHGDDGQRSACLPRLLKPFSSRITPQSLIVIVIVIGPCFFCGVWCPVNLSKSLSTPPRDLSRVHHALNALFPGRDWRSSS